MDQSFSSSLIGIAQVDVVSRRGTTHFYDLEIQHMTVQPNGDDMDSHQVEIKASVYSDSHVPAEGSVIWMAGPWLALAAAYVRFDSWGLLFQGDHPENFEPVPPTATVVGQVMEHLDQHNGFRIRLAEYDARTNSRRSFEAVVARLGPRWKSAPKPRIGSVVQVRGSVYELAAVSHVYTISADAINFLNVAVDPSSSGGSPQKRKFTSYKKSDKEKDKEEDNADDNSGEGSSAPVTPKGNRRAAK